MRIVSLAPSVTSILLAIGARKELVGVTKWCKEIADIGSRPQVGDCWKLDIRPIMRLKPSLLIGSVPFATQTVATILEQPVAFLALNPRSLTDIEANIRLLGEITGKETRASKLIGEMRAGFAAIKRQTRALGRTRKLRVYCEAWPNPRISSPPWVSEIIQLAGGVPALPAGQRIEDDKVARAKPDLIVLAWTATGDRARPQTALRNPLWKSVPAVKSGRIVVILDELLNTPGPPLLKGASALLQAMYPGLSK
ncbi:MAG TPA: ABC transporter substrate-binding protein [Candidatus Acidoferrales bacterium]|jgi:iron complex transport system substrate-binding protein|nr:ABC transporter substrate-binding protein [Candidatus Acidoferrales bacterium]